MRFPKPRDSVQLPDELGQDSFLDTIANLVGVLIILVVVVGARAQHLTNPDSAVLERQKRVELAREQLQNEEVAASNVLAEYHELERQMAEDERLLQLKSLARMELLSAITQIEQDVAQRQASLDRETQEQMAALNEIRSLKQQRDELVQRTTALRADTNQPRAIEHLPTPIAKTVFRDDVHFLLDGGRIVHVPLEELIQLMRNEWETKAEKLQGVSRISESVGPIAGFRLQYELVARRTVQPSPAGPITGRTIEFDHFAVYPILQSNGEPMDHALDDHSAFATQLASLDPHKHTISVWVYPNSYSEFNRLKRWLYDRGFQTASWPLSEGGRISGGPNGYRPSAQ